MIGPEADHHFEKLPPAVDRAQQRVACDFLAQDRLLVFIASSRFVPQSFKTAGSQIAHRVVDIGGRELFANPVFNTERAHPFKIARPWPIRWTRKQMKGRIYLATSRHT